MGTTTNRSDNGFSIVEMLVVLSVIGLFLFIALPSISGVRRQSPARFAEQVSLLAQATKISAIKDNKERAIFVDIAKRRVLSDIRETSLAIPDHLTFAVAFGRGQEQATTEARIAFFPDGGSTGGSLVFTDQDGSQAVIAINWLTASISLRESER